MIESLEELADRVCDLSEAAGAEGLCRVSRSRLGLTRFANSFIHQHHGEDTTAVAVTVALDGRVASASTSNTSAAGLATLVDDAVAAARLQPVDPNWPGVSAPDEGGSTRPADPSTIEAGPSERVDQVADFIEAGSGLRAAGYLDNSYLQMAVATTAGQRISGETARASIDGIHQTATSAGSGHQTSRSFADVVGATVGERAARLARDGAEPVDLDPGEYQVVLSPECVATMAVFLGAYGFGGRMLADGQSFARLGEQQFDGSFGLVEDPTDSRSLSIGFDIEGTPTRKVTLVEGGVTTAVVYDRKTAGRVGEETTGHAMAEDFLGPLPLNLIVAGGTVEAQDLIAAVERGIYVNTFNYCRILDPRTQVVTGLTRNGTFMIENGELTQPVSNLRFTQSFVEALGPGRIEAIGADQRYADSEFGAGLVIAPSLRLAGWNFTGGAKG